MYLQKSHSSRLLSDILFKLISFTENRILFQNNI